MQEAYIVAGFRTAVTKSKKGGFRFMRSDELAIEVIKGLMKTLPSVDPKLVDDVIVGNAVPEAEQGLQFGRIIAAKALGIEVPGITINRYCASGLESIAMATAKIRTGMADCIIAGGTESMSMVPTAGWKTVPAYSITVDEPDYYLSMGLTAEAVANEYKISREDQDAFALASHQKAKQAIENGYFKKGILPIEINETFINEKNKRATRNYIIDTDEGVRADTTIEALGKLKPAFALNGSVTAGNSSQTSDGSSFVMVMGEKLMNSLGLKPIGRLVNCASAGVHPRIMGIGPVEATNRALAKAGLTLDQIDIIELNEAFAAQALACTRALGIADNDPRLNPNGGSIAIGHPLGVTGARIAYSAALELQLKGKRYALITMCIGVGQGYAAIIERV
jgi:acetyl-CoA acyltransferase